MTSMKERLAMAIYDNKPGPDGTEVLRDEPWRSCIPAPEAVLAVLREPTEEMLNAAEDMTGRGEMRRIYTAMLGAALHPSPAADIAKAKPPW